MARKLLCSVVLCVTLLACQPDQILRMQQVLSYYQTFSIGLHLALASFSSTDPRFVMANVALEGLDTVVASYYDMLAKAQTTGEIPLPDQLTAASKALQGALLKANEVIGLIKSNQTVPTG